MKNSKDLRNVMARLQEIGTKVQLDNVLETKYMNNGQHFTSIEDLNKFELPSEEESNMLKPKQDADIKTGKGQIGGYRFNSIFSTFTEKSSAFSINVEESRHNERDHNMLKEVTEFIKYCVDNGYTTTEEIDTMCSMSLGSKQAQEYIQADGKSVVELNAYALHTIYGAYLGKISNAINKAIKPAVTYLEKTMPSIDLSEKSDRWIYDKAKHALDENWNNEIAILFKNKEILTEQLAQKANTLTIGDSPFRYALTMAGLYYTVFSREENNYNRHVSEVMNSLSTEENQTEYQFSGISSVFSLFSIGTADFLFQYKQLQANEEVIQKDFASFNANLVLFKFKPEDADKVETIYNQNLGFWDAEVTMETIGNDVKFMDIFTVDHASDSTSLIKQMGKQLLTEKDLRNVYDDTRKEVLLEKHGKTEFKKHGLFSMKHDSYKGKVVHTVLYKSMIKVWMVDVIGINNAKEVNTLSNQMTFGLDSNKDKELIDNEISKEVSRKAINNFDYYDASQDAGFDYGFDNSQVVDVYEPADDNFIETVDVELPAEAYEQFVEELENKYANAEYLGF